jgi:tetratricopeptide (TPR) repeat protein
MKRSRLQRRARSDRPAAIDRLTPWWQSTAARLALFLLGVFAIKLVVLLQLKDHILLQLDTTVDTQAYVGLAKRVLAGDWWLGPGLYFISPLYIYFLAVVDGVTGSFVAVRVVQIVLGTLSVGLLFFTAREWFGDRAAWCAATLAALTGLFSFYEAVILQASIDAVLTSAALLCLTLAFTRGTPGWFGFAGLMFGIQSLNRPNMIVAAVGIIALLLVFRLWRPSLLVAAGFVIALAPSAVRNVVVSHQWSLVSSHGGLNFYIGNDAAATGFFRAIPGIGLTMEGQEHDTRVVAEKAVGRPLTDAQVSAYFSDLAWTWIRGHPIAWGRLMARKIYYVFNAQHVALPLSYPFYAYDARTALRFLFVGPWLLIPLGLLGLALAPMMPGALPLKRPVEYLVWVSFVPVYGVAVAIFFVAERYRLPLFVPLAIGAGAGVEAVVRLFAARNIRWLVVSAAAFATLLVAANWNLHVFDGDGRMEERVHMAENLARHGQVAEAERWAALALPGYPYPSLLHYRVGSQFVVSEQWAAAIAYLSAAVKDDPGALRAQFLLGQALAGAGRHAEAIPHFEAAVDGGVDFDLPGYDLALEFEQTGDRAGVLRVLRTLKPGPGDDVDTWLSLGRLAAEVKAPDVAEPFFRHAAGMAPESAEARQQFGFALLLLGRREDAARELLVAVGLDPRNVDSLANLGYCEMELGRIADARGHVAAALRLAPTQSLALQLQATLARIK